MHCSSPPFVRRLSGQKQSKHCGIAAAAYFQGGWFLLHILLLLKLSSVALAENDVKEVFTSNAAMGVGVILSGSLCFLRYGGRRRQGIAS